MNAIGDTIGRLLAEQAAIVSKIAGAVKYDPLNPLRCQTLKKFAQFLAGFFVEIIRKPNIFVGQTRLLGRALRRKDILDPVFRDISDFKVSFFGKAL